MSISLWLGAHQPIHSFRNTFLEILDLDIVHGQGQSLQFTPPVKILFVDLSQGIIDAVSVNWPIWREECLMIWSDEAKEALSKVPFFVRRRVRKRVEEEAARSGAHGVSLEHVRSCQQTFLTRMEDEVKGYQIEACFGPSGCPNRAFVSEGLSEKLEERLSERDLKAFLKKRVAGPLKMHHEFRISISDCPNACSRPQIADIGFLGACMPRISDQECSDCGACVEVCKEDAISVDERGPIIDRDKCLYCGQCIRVCPTETLKEGESGYRIQVGGKLGRHPRLATELPSLFDRDALMQMIDRCLDHYQKHCRRGERFGEILQRDGLDDLKNDLKPVLKP
jgi:dissimilatory sulfite reductase (desulfoviridin) alpha/beta subunit